MKFARIVYGAAAVYGFLVLLPLYVLIGKIGRDAPPGAHPSRVLLRLCGCRGPLASRLRAPSARSVSL